MDPLPKIFDGPRARNAFLLKVRMSAPWAIRVEDDAPLTVVVMLSGSACYSLEGNNKDPLVVEAGNLLLIRESGAYVLADRLGTRPGYFIGVGQNCSGSNGENLAQDLSTGLRSWGNDVGGPDAMLVGTYRSSGEVGDLLLSSLPSHTLVTPAENPIVDVLLQELQKDGITQASVLDRLLDLLLMGAVRTWTSGMSEGHSWMASGRDPAVQEAIKLLHGSPDRPWTAGSLAGSVGMSRASLARRFHQRVGKPPMTYLNQWRLAKAADLLADPQPTLTTISRQVGYASPFSFSAAFKKRYGMSPQEYRRRRPGTS